MKQLYYYTILRFVPDIIRNEPRNIGIVIFDKDFNEIIRYIPKEVFVSKLSEDLWEDTNAMFTHYLEFPPSIEEFNTKWCEDTMSCLQFSKALGIVTADILDKEVEYLTKTFL